MGFSKICFYYDLYIFFCGYFPFSLLIWGSLLVLLSWLDQCASNSLFAPPPSVFPPSSVLSGSRRPSWVAESPEQPCQRAGAQVGGAAGGKQCHGLSRPGALKPLPSPGSHLHVSMYFLISSVLGWGVGVWAMTSPGACPRYPSSPHPAHTSGSRWALEACRCHCL